MGGLMLALFLSSLDQTVVSTAMPRIIADLGGFDRFTWVTTAYLVASTTTVPIVGRLSDLYGRKVFFLSGIVVFLVGSVLAGVSQSMNQLIVFRAIQGIGGGSMMALSFTTVGDLFPPAERGKYQGVVAAVFGLSSVIGPTLGGFITDNLSWNWIFYVNVPLGLPVIALFIRFFPNTRPERRTVRLDYAGNGTACAGGSCRCFIGLSLGGVQYDWLSLQIVGILVVAAVMTVVFVLVERRADDPIMPLGIYANPVVSISLVAVFITGFRHVRLHHLHPAVLSGRAGRLGHQQRFVPDPHDAEHGSRRHVVRTGAVTPGRPLPPTGDGRDRDHDGRNLADLAHDA